MQITRWQNVWNLKKHLAQSSFGRAQIALFHCTPMSCEKKDKWNFDSKSGKIQSKEQIKIVTRQKRADSKKALKRLLYNCGDTTILQEEKKVWRIKGPNNWGSEPENDTGSSDKKEKHSSRRAKNIQNNKLRKKLRKERLSEELHNQQVFKAKFGNKSHSWSFKPWEGFGPYSKSYSWSFKPWEDFEPCSNSTGFEWWRDSRSWNYNKKKEQDTSSENEFENERYSVGSYSDRTTLGLPVQGPLQIEDVKTAFRTSALKWHPDKHQGAVKAVAEEKFKLCVNAYNSLCTALSAV